MTHYPAAHINSIAEEGTKAEAVEWLQKTWNELCAALAINRELLAALEEAGDHLEYCGYGDKWERECAIDGGLDKRIEAAIAKAKEGK